MAARLVESKALLESRRVLAIALGMRLLRAGVVLLRRLRKPLAR